MWGFAVSSESGEAHQQRKRKRSKARFEPPQNPARRNDDRRRVSGKQRGHMGHGAVSMSGLDDAAGRVAPRALSRAAGLLVLWLVLSGADPADLPAGLVAVVAATWTSLILLPPGSSRFSLAALARLALRFAYQSAVAGVDVARRALDPRLPLRPGFVAYPVRFPPGPTRNTFTSLTSLLPGTVPAGEKSGVLVYHCLDIDQPIVSRLPDEAGALPRALGHD